MVIQPENRGGAPAILYALLRLLTMDPSMLIDLIRRAIPRLFDAFATVESRLSTPWEAESIRRLYSGLPPADFSKDVLMPRAVDLAVLPVKGVAWSDLGESRRVMATLARLGVSWP